MRYQMKSSGALTLGLQEISASIYSLRILI